MELQHGGLRPGEERRTRKSGVAVYGITRNLALCAIEAAVLDYWMGHGHTLLQLNVPSSNAATLTQCPCCVRNSPPLQRYSQ